MSKLFYTVSCVFTTKYPNLSKKSRVIFVTDTR